jgi:hypothetical protein
VPNKKEKFWTMGMPKGGVGPWVWHVRTKGSKKPVRIVAFDLDHIRCQLEGRTVIRAEKQPEEKDEYSSMPLGPKGSAVNRPADYDAGFKILRSWVDENGGPPEEIRVKLRELYIDYDRAPQKTTRYSARRKKRHKI